MCVCVCVCVFWGNASESQHTHTNTHTHTRTCYEEQGLRAEVLELGMGGANASEVGTSGGAKSWWYTILRPAQRCTVCTGVK